MYEIGRAKTAFGQASVKLRRPSRRTYRRTGKQTNSCCRVDAVIAYESVLIIYNRRPLCECVYVAGFRRSVYVEVGLWFVPAAEGFGFLWGLLGGLLCVKSLNRCTDKLHVWFLFGFVLVFCTLTLVFDGSELLSGMCLRLWECVGLVWNIVLNLF